MTCQLCGSALEDIEAGNGWCSHCRVWVYQAPEKDGDAE